MAASDDVDGVYENGNRLAESMPGAFHAPKREGERQRLQRLVILWKNSSPLYKKNNGLICPYFEALCGGHCLASGPKPTSLADLIKSSVLCAIFSKNGRFWPYREGH
jgi:hypothetical protein